jgi:hypothetical protein
MTNNVSAISVGLAHELSIAFVKAGFHPDELGFLAQDAGTLENLRDVLCGKAVVHHRIHEIDCDAEPNMAFATELHPDHGTWSLVEHLKGGTLEWDSSKVGFWTMPEQHDKKFGKRPTGEIIRGKLNEEGKMVLNANVLDFLLKNWHLIPKWWKGKRIIFWGTIYRRQHKGHYDYLAVRCLDFKGDPWNPWGWSYHYLDDGGRYSSNHVSAVLKT